MTTLYIIYSNAPYVGLLGTVVGIMITFYDMGQASSINTTAIMTGLSLALYATALGLVVAIPTLIAYNGLNRKIAVISSEFKDFLSGNQEKHHNSNLKSHHLKLNRPNQEPATSDIHTLTSHAFANAALTSSANTPDTITAANVVTTDTITTTSALTAAITANAIHTHALAKSTVKTDNIADAQDTPAPNAAKHNSVTHSSKNALSTNDVNAANDASVDRNTHDIRDACDTSDIRDTSDVLAHKSTKDSEGHTHHTAKHHSLPGMHMPSQLSKVTTMAAQVTAKVNRAPAV